MDVFLVDQDHHGDYELPNRKKRLIDKFQILILIKDGKKDVVHPRNTHTQGAQKLTRNL